MSSILIRNATIINEGKTFNADLHIVDELISAIGLHEEMNIPDGTRNIDASGMYLIPGVIDDHVHFREPGLTHKGDINSESKAAIAGGVTSFMEMPNTIPQTISLETLNEKYLLASEKSLANYSFYIGATNSNLDEVMKADPSEVCGIKLFMGSSTGNMITDDETAIKELFARANLPVAVHCEDHATIVKNSEIFRKKYGDEIPIKMHSLIRSREACFISSSHAVQLAKEFNTRLHILHISTADELKLLKNDLPLQEKRITGEVCVHHLWFEESSYDKLGTHIKWNPSIKTRDRKSVV